jgi:hypothetical protein
MISEKENNELIKINGVIIDSTFIFVNYLMNFKIKIVSLKLLK